LPIEQIENTVRQHIAPLISYLPDKRLGRVAELIILGILGGQTPVITEIARHSSKDEGETWAVAKSIYRWVENERFDSRDLFAGLYPIGQQPIAAEPPAYLVVAVDPGNFEKPYAEAVEGVSVVHPATPPVLDGKARLTHGHLAISATTVNTKVPVTTYANWVSYKTADFISQNQEIAQAFNLWAYAISSSWNKSSVPTPSQAGGKPDRSARRAGMAYSGTAVAPHVWPRYDSQPNRLLG